MIGALDAPMEAPRTRLAGLKKKGHAVEVLKRICQVGLHKTGAKGSFTIYRVTE